MARESYNDLILQLGDLARERLANKSNPPRTMEAAQLSGPMRLLIEIVAERSRRTPNDFAVRILVGAVLGAGIAVMFAAMQDPQADIVVLLDEAMAQLEAGLPM